ncbi:transcriptional regulator, TetR family [Pseudorhodobacter antarcticus]|uniref:Transcriptional regulator, TetR family n=1 Tax=Pseudorhodobacter antarcticus TaxID=1077947 RepID=A0A1H8N4Z3_9RHOB|nr:TetR/AcrR family transcriptional regulator [Pseudorhodobacter antarcticus]SEO24721.1 transcriptional regulator, TetR family [Pseudorhodobacter antarcticus]
MSAEPQPIHPRKLEIVEAAVTCFLEKGYHQTGVRDIVGQAGISLGNLYNHFKGKEAILVFIAKIEGQELSDFIDRLSDNDDPRATLGWFITDYAAYVSLPENALLGAEILTESLRNPAIADVFGRNRSRLIAALAGCITQGTKSGIFAPQVDPHMVACLILDALEGKGLRSLSSPSGDNLTRDAIGSFILNGLKP